MSNSNDALVVYKGGSSDTVWDAEAWDNIDCKAQGKTTTATVTNYPTYTYNKSAEGFVGLSNQGATCYMNSLLQSLYMTPEFRRALYAWTYSKEKDGVEQDCIPLQLQKLFGALQLTKSRDIDTKALTKSFGWESGEVFQQQDIQELCRVLFDALEETFRGTSLETVIDDIYAGQIVDYVKCLDVEYSSERCDKVQDFSLAIRPYGSTVPVKSLDEAIMLFLKPEVLDGDNQYFVESAGRKSDAIKGLKVGRIPYVLTFQLKRFVYDFSTGDVVQKKLNDCVSFPMFLDMNKYLARSADEKRTTEETLGDFEAYLSEEMLKLRTNRESHPELNSTMSPSVFKASGSSAQISQVVLDDAYADSDIPPLILPKEDGLYDCGKEAWEIKCEGNGNPAPIPDVVKGEPQALPKENELKTLDDALVALDTNGEWVYELFAVLVHAGAIYGGHYYAYIKDLDTGKWMNFNDSSVTEINEETVKESWGGSTSSYGAAYQRSANAYMLQYRKVSRPKQAVSESELSRAISGGGHICGSMLGSTFPSADLVPQYIVESIEEAEKERKAKDLATQERLNSIVIKVAFRGKDYSIPCKKQDSLQQVLFAICRVVNLRPCDYENESDHGSVKVNDWELTDEDCQEILLKYARLRGLNFSVPKAMAEAYQFDVTDLTLPVQHYAFYENKCFVLETKRASEGWPVYKASDFTFQCFEFDEASGMFKEPREMRISKEMRVEDIRGKIASWVSYDISEILMVKLSDNYHSQDVIAEEIFADVLEIDRYYTLNSTHTTYNIYWERKKKSEEFISINDCMCRKVKLQEKNKLVLKINLTKMLADPEYAATLTAPNVEINFNANKTWTVQDFKDALIKEFGIDPTLPFKMQKWYLENNAAYELSDMEKKLADTHLTNSALVYIVPGKPSKAGYLKVKLVMLIPPTSASFDGSPVSVTAEATPIVDSEGVYAAEAAITGTVLPPSEAVPIDDKVDVPTTSATMVNVISGNAVTAVAEDDDSGAQLRMFGRKKINLDYPDSCFGEPIEVQVSCTKYTVSETKRIFYDELVSLGIIRADVSIDRIRVREKSANRCQRVLREDMTWRDITIFQNKEFAIEILDHDEKLKSCDQEVFLYYQKWHRKTWTVGERVALPLDRKKPLNDISGMLAKLSGIEDASKLMVLHVPSYSSIPISDLDKDKPTFSNSWCNFSTNTNLLSSLGNALSDGDLLLIQDSSEELRVFTQEEKDIIATARSQYGGGSYDSSYSGVYTGGTTYKRPAEKGIKIKTQKDRERERSEGEKSTEKDGETLSTTTGSSHSGGDGFSPLFSDLLD